ncbi:MAG: phospholipase D-like domain-containing protein [Planctomycetota bacterium]
MDGSTVAWTVGATLELFSIWTAGHALIRKRSPRSALAWVVACLMFPILGAGMYWLIGQNRVFTRARKLRERFPTREELDAEALASKETLASVVDSEHALESLLQIARTGDALTAWPLTSGNAFEPLENGDRAYPELLAAIREARESVDLMVYLFDGERVVAEFAAALAAARERGVEVRVLLDGLGDLITRRQARRALEARGVTVARFLPPTLSERGLHINLRNHRKLLIVDGRIAFTGGMNLRDVCELERQPPGASRVRDLQFRVRGPVVNELARVFEEDWSFSTRSPFREPAQRAEQGAGDAVARVVPDGPNEDRDTLKWLITAAVSAARTRVRIQTPYLIPPEELEAVLLTASLRGLTVQVLVPADLDHPYVGWAMRPMVRDMVRRGVELRFQPGTFAHTKLITIDDGLSIVGSANMDPRSLRLNFELGVTVYDRDLTAALNEMFERDWAQSTPLTVDELAADPLWRRLRDNLARLASPYL